MSLAAARPVVPRDHSDGAALVTRMLAAAMLTKHVEFRACGLQFGMCLQTHDNTSIIPLGMDCRSVAKKYSTSMSNRACRTSLNLDERESRQESLFRSGIVREVRNHEHDTIDPYPNSRLRFTEALSDGE